MKMTFSRISLRRIGILLILFAAFSFITDIAIAAEGFTSGYSDDAADNKFNDVCQKSLGYLQEGGFSALLAAVAGIGAIIASAMGGFRMAWALLIVSLGSYILGQYVGLFFEDSCGITTGADE